MGKLLANQGSKNSGWIVLRIKCLSVYLFSLSVIFSLASSQVFHLAFYKPRLNRIRDLRQTNPIDANCVRVITLAGSNDASDFKESK